MYVGRIVGVGRTLDGRPAASYRISSRSFPNRTANRMGRSVQIVPKDGSRDAASDSPYITYECLVWDERFVVVSNGTHTRPIFERLKAGNAPRDAIASVLMGLDREFDEHDTPRICGTLDLMQDRLWLGSVTAQSFHVVPMAAGPGQLAYITTFEFPHPSRDQLDPSFAVHDSDQVCQHMMGNSVFSRFDQPVCATAAVVTSDGTAVSVLNPPS